MMRHFSLVFLSLFLLSCGQEQQAAKPASSNSPAPATGRRPDAARDSTDHKMAHEAYHAPLTHLPPDLAAFIPAGYAALDTTSGDLNLDAYPDIVLVLKKNGEDTSSNVVEHPEKRPLLLLTGGPDNRYKLAARNDAAVYCIDCGGVMGDPYMDVVIRKGFFSIEHYGGSGWRWTRTVTFRYSPAERNWFLHKDGGDSFHAADPEKVTTKVRTTKDFGKVPFESFDIYAED